MPFRMSRGNFVLFLSSARPDVSVIGLVNILIAHDPFPLNVSETRHCLWLSYAYESSLAVGLSTNVADSARVVNMRAK